MALFFDLDGPLLDVRPRYVQLHHDLLGRLGARGMPAADYWRRKRAAVPEERILEELGLPHLAPAYCAERQRLIETAEYLALDQPWPWAAGVLSRLSRRWPLVLVTARGCRDLLLWQLERLGLTPYFAAVLSEAAGADVAGQKARLIRGYLESQGGPAGRGLGMVGDTEADVGAGRRLGLVAAAVLSGIRDEAHLAACGPDHLLSDIRDLPWLGKSEGATSRRPPEGCHVSNS